MKEKDRLRIIRSLKIVDEAYLSIDIDRTVRETLRKIKPDIFATGSDHTPDNTMEYKTCQELGIKFAYGVGGKKVQSSSSIINNIK